VNYNLLEEKWLPILKKEGKFERLGIIEALTQAHRIRQIAASNPMDRVAILRFLLALLYWCKGNPPNKIPDGSFPPDWFEKLQDNKDCFNLLGEVKRFYQCKPEFGKDEKLTANYLVQEIPTGTNISHFKHSTDGINGLCRACCVMGLLRLPAFATSGGRGKPPGINAKPPIYVIPLGSSLAETLRLSWRQVSFPNLGIPAWEKPDLQLSRTGEIPLLTGLTWLPRHVWLGNPTEPKANCISCGHREQLIHHCVFVGIGSTKSEGNRLWSDPHVIYDGKEVVVKPGNALGASDGAAGQWAKIIAGIQRSKKANVPRKLWVVGFDTVQNDKYLDRDYAAGLPAAVQKWFWEANPPSLTSTSFLFCSQIVSWKP
jgi:CRISPR type I-E-associated protein CasA/Cse1